LSPGSENLGVDFYILKNTSVINSTTHVFSSSPLSDYKDVTPPDASGSHLESFLATEEAESRRIAVQSQPRQTVLETLS
jgi:hypothetical protein